MGMCVVLDQGQRPEWLGLGGSRLSSARCALEGRSGCVCQERDLAVILKSDKTSEESCRGVT